MMAMMTNCENEEAKHLHSSDELKQIHLCMAILKRDEEASSTK